MTKGSFCSIAVVHHSSFNSAAVNLLPDVCVHVCSYNYCFRLTSYRWSGG